MKNPNLIKTISALLKFSPTSEDELHQAKRAIAKRFELAMPTNAGLLKAYRQYLKQTNVKPNQALLNVLKRRSIRTLSGVAPITVLTKAYPCPGRCVYCPTEIRMPKSYLASEPAAQRAVQNHFDPFRQVKSRIAQLEKNGHVADKIELIVLGGTWSFYPEKYQNWFIKRCFDAANGKSSLTLAQAQKLNETAKRRIIGLTLETRPDYVTKAELWRMRELGCTHVQIGVQSLDQKVLDLNKRDDSIVNIGRAMGLLKDFGFKITFHIMPGMPGATPASDLKTFKKLFSDRRFQPDMLKIYPTVVIKSALLYQWWRTGKYKPYTDVVLQNLLVRIKKLIPPYVRINRLIRDIPGPDIIDGNLVTNLRQRLRAQGVICQCIRCREVRGEKFSEKDLTLVKRSYPANQGQEYFLSFESRDRRRLFAFVRLRLPDKFKKPAKKVRLIRFFDKKEITAETQTRAFDEKTALIRELHTYGELMPVGSGRKAVQHIGLGKRLMRAAEDLAKAKGFERIAVIAGIGVREYYRKLGYNDEKTYVVKPLK
ncbi:tRNA uridine(34) 5-carboxymethylaminomethyl modification radical SAM/GNAT enzyme Elp3 [Candidatus Parcubacteria bacterium]|jgi:elongator complex protein 3|nr:MAG: tRNA uridine(34) 5-carboxymethylaminomethyl modification radical SAM/GNAT enzyme Elp3 [Candidatus Parcubacteria bacterium]